MTASSPPELALDTSALVVALQREEPAERLLAALDAADSCYVSAATVIELGLVMLGRFGEASEREADVLLSRLGAQVVPVTADHVDLARSAYRRFGKSRHATGLSFSNCFSYALAAALDIPLLFTGEDFARPISRQACRRPLERLVSASRHIHRKRGSAMEDRSARGAQTPIGPLPLAIKRRRNPRCLVAGCPVEGDTTNRLRTTSSSFRALATNAKNSLSSDQL